MAWVSAEVWRSLRSNPSASAGPAPYPYSPPPHCPYPQQAASLYNGIKEFQQALQCPFHSNQL